MAELEIARIELDQTCHCASFNRIEALFRCYTPTASEALL